LSAPGLNSLLKRACAIGRRRDGLAESTLKIYRDGPSRGRDRLLALKPAHKASVRRVGWGAGRPQSQQPARFERILGHAGAPSQLSA
jgi:hypothetical protein